MCIVYVYVAQHVQILPGLLPQPPPLALVLVAAILLAWKLDLFQRARIVRNQGEAGQASQPTEMEMK